MKELILFLILVVMVSAVSCSQQSSPMEVNTFNGAPQKAHIVCYSGWQVIYDQLVDARIWEGEDALYLIQRVDGKPNQRLTGDCIVSYQTDVRKNYGKES